MDEYKGYKEIQMTDSDMALFYEGKYHIESDFVENEYLIIKNDDGKIVDKKCYQNGKFRNLYDRLSLNTAYFGRIHPRNLQQELAFDMLQDNTSKIKMLTGKFGVGKDFLMIAHALKEIEEGKADKIIWVRNNVEVKDTARIGFLPGSLYEKMIPWLGPFIDHCGDMEGVSRLMEEHKLEVVHLGFIRGRDFKNSIILSTEDENLTKEQFQLLIGRVGEGSQLWLNSDNKQRDKKVFEDSQGTEILIDKLKGNRNFGYIKLEKTERSEIAALADLLDK